MSETKFVNCVFYEGIFLTILGLCILLLPKISALTFGFTLCLIYILYGGYKIISGFLKRKILKFYIFEIITGILILVAGILLFFIPSIDVMHVIAIIGIYLVFESILTSAFMQRARTILTFWRINYLSAFLEMFFGIIIIILLSPSALWIAGVLSGLNFLIKGIIMINIYFAEEYVRI